MSIVALTVSSGCHFAIAAFKPTLGENVVVYSFKTLGANWKEEKRLLLLNLCLTGGSNGVCVILRSGTRCFKAKACG